MADLELDLEELDNDINNQNRVEKRIKDLSSAVKMTSEERDAERAKAQEAEAARIAAEKERDFFKDFSATSSKYPGASEYLEDIKNKVMSGYTVDDATVATLAAQGKLNIAAPQEPRETVAGGSAVNQLTPSGSSKTIGEMTQEERRAKLVEAERAGDISS